jgi:hypothetical protein
MKICHRLDTGLSATVDQIYFIRGGTRIRDGATEMGII